MFQTAFTLHLTQFARVLSFPERLQRTPGRNISLEALRQRNTTLDACFYDVKVVTPEEAFYISDSLAAEGSILIVPPTGAGPLILCDTLDDYLMQGGLDVHVLAVAGVGSSALGSAAFARNIADAVGEKVAVVVSGYGLADVVTEALGGYFLFGWLNGLRNGFEILDDLSGRPRFGATPDTNWAAAAAPRNSRDTQTVLALLADPRLSFRLLTGHSKGNLVLSEALYALRKIDPARAMAIGEAALVVTFSARITMPPSFTRVIDVIGQWDWFGEMNSRASIDTDKKVPKAWHHTNTDIPGHLPVTKILTEILDQSLPVAAAPAEAPVLAATPEPAAVEPVAAEPAAAEPMTATLTEPVAEPEPSEVMQPDIEAAPVPAEEDAAAVAVEQIDEPVEPVEITVAASDPAPSDEPALAVAAAEDAGGSVEDTPSLHKPDAEPHDGSPLTVAQAPVRSGFAKKEPAGRKPRRPSRRGF